MFESVWLLFALPALGALIILFAGQWMSQKVVGWVASAAVLAAFVVSVMLFFSLTALPSAERSITITWWQWMTIGDFKVPAAVLIDPLSVTMAMVVTGVGALIHIYSIGYMDHEPRYQRFFFYLNFFILAMLTLVMSNNFLGMFVGWEGVGLASFLLIGFWFDKRDDMYGWYADCGKKAFIVNRIGDFGMILAMIMVWSTLGTLVFTELGETVHHLAPATAAIICLLLLLGAAGKSAQIPLYVWLPDAMAGPTPVSALIHAATMVTAGVYMIIRTNLLWHVGVPAGEVAAWIGMLTALLAATIAMGQTDLKKILAYSTVSQLGYMVAAAGMAAYGAALFHLVTHAFFKALLFLAAGSVMHATDGILDINRLGGLRAKMPTTYRTFLVGAAALAGIPLLSGFFSKDAILVAALDHNILLYIVGAVTALLTAVYSFRAVFLTFHGQPRDPHIFEHVHESPRIMTTPLWILAFLSLVGGVINLPFILSLEHWLEPVVGEHEKILLVTELLGITLSIVIAVFGFLLARALYLRHESWAERLAAPIAFLRPMIEHKWYVDELYRATIVNPLKAVSGWFARVFDPKVIDGAVNGVGAVVNDAGEAVRKLQNGAIPTYALSIFLGVVAVLFYFLFIG
ncbi:MAG TPA: NADH-quinone oxidoreductase subunit L [Chloroflexi bacterium]|nr:NADH-quinone oxidoreductase subunit L [Chloroflexota bacterium]HHW87715.1 NADH-quinone oxidoreductase subunit L [Chloroflexota bacterium]